MCSRNVALLKIVTNKLLIWSGVLYTKCCCGTKTDRTGQPRKDSEGRNGRTGLAGQASQDGRPRKDSQERTARVSVDKSGSFSSCTAETIIRNSRDWWPDGLWKKPRWAAHHYKDTVCMCRLKLFFVPFDLPNTVHLSNENCVNKEFYQKEKVDHRCAQKKCVCTDFLRKIHNWKKNCSAQ